jgi:hypothetical protein
VLGLHVEFLLLRQAGPILACARSCREVLFAAPKSGGGSFAARAGVAQWQSTCFVNRWLGVQVPSSARCCRVRKENYYGGLPEWPKGADCKSAGYAFDGSNPSPSTAPPKQCRRKEARSPRTERKKNTESTLAGVAQLVERQPSKLNVAGSNPVSRSPVVRKGSLALLVLRRARSFPVKPSWIRF